MVCGGTHRAANSVRPKVKKHILKICRNHYKCDYDFQRVLLQLIKLELTSIGMCKTRRFNLVNKFGKKMK